MREAGAGACGAEVSARDSGSVWDGMGTAAKRSNVT